MSKYTGKMKYYTVLWPGKVLHFPPKMWLAVITGHTYFKRFLSTPSLVITTDLINPFSSKYIRSIQVSLESRTPFSVKGLL